MIGAGFIDFPIIAYHFQLKGVATPVSIPLVYSVAMGVEGVPALALGKWFDRNGIIALIVSSALSACVAPLVFFGGFEWALAGMVLWGIGMGGQQSVMRAILGPPRRSRGKGDGLWNI